MKPRARKPRRPPHPATVTIVRGITLASLLTLLGALAAGILTGGTPPLLLVPALLPLLIFAPTVYRAEPRGLAALCFVCLLYFCVIMTRLFAPDADIWDALAMGAVVILFVAAMLYSRWRRTQLAAV